MQTAVDNEDEKETPDSLVHDFMQDSLVESECIKKKATHAESKDLMDQVIAELSLPAQDFMTKRYDDLIQYLHSLYMHAYLLRW